MCGEIKMCRCSEICPFYKIFEKASKIKEESETVQHLKSAKTELISALKSVMKDVIKQLSKKK